jgi:DNA anti-recombination protein RmuC
MARSVKLCASLFVASFALAVGGCTASQGQQNAVATGPEDGGWAAQRFQDPPADGRTAVESAIELSEKYAKLSDETATLRQDNQRLASENQNLQQQVVSLEARLQQTQKELNEANELLLEMLTELNNWKSNILGFRGEMRQAAQAQLEALLKVLEILGGQAEAGALESRHASTLNPDMGEVPQADTSSAPVGSEPNELQ